MVQSPEPRRLAARCKLTDQDSQWIEPARPAVAPIVAGGGSPLSTERFVAAEGYAVRIVSSRPFDSAACAAASLAIGTR